MSGDSLDLADYLSEDQVQPAGSHPQGSAAFLQLTLGAVGVVYGDIGTSPLYAFREALRPIARSGTVTEADILGLLSLVIWALILIVTVKYVLFLLRIDNRGEGGILALYTMLRLAIGRRSIPVLVLAVIGAALFFGDATITPAISVMSAVEGVGHYMPQLSHWVVPLTLAILIGLFVAQSHGTGPLSAAFGPITVIWFLTLAGLGLWHVMSAPQVLSALSPVWGVDFLIEHSALAFAVLGAVFLAVTGAEALYADLGHFGRRPIIAAWFGLIFPALVLNYMGQGAIVLTDPSAISDPLFSMVPDAGMPWFIGLATLATVIAAQAVITGAYSMTRAAIQLGLLPRMRIRHTSSRQHGQIYIPAVNWALLVAVVLLVIGFASSESLASAYGIAVTGTMVVTSTLAILYILRSRRMPVALVLPLALFLLSVEMVFLVSNLTKFADGGSVPVIMATAIAICMWAWWRGTQKLLQKLHRSSVDLDSFVRIMKDSSVHRVPGTAFFLTADANVAPSTLLHNIKNNSVLHAQTVIMTVETLRVPVAPEEERISLKPLDGPFTLLTLRFGFMETPKIVRSLALARDKGFRFDAARTVFFVARRRPVASGKPGLDFALDRLHSVIHRFAADPSDYFHLPRDRVVELGERVAV
ncbi:potassium transporter Kup [Paracoccus sp. (in: a-proteobacteria)]|uniref:potassium transporter Kup n=1 Tax=Paracoccus sp. TaxID=267 RepID=UPI003A84E390